MEDIGNNLKRKREDLGEANHSEYIEALALCALKSDFNDESAKRQKLNSMEEERINQLENLGTTQTYQPINSDQLKEALERISVLEEQNRILTSKLREQSNLFVSPETEKKEEEQLENPPSISVVSHPQASVVYHRILKPFPTLKVENCKSSSLGDYVVDVSLLNSSGEELPIKHLFGSTRVIVPIYKSSVTVAFRKIKIMATSQQLSCLFRLKFTLKRIINCGQSEIETIIGSTVTNSIEVFSHSLYLKNKSDDKPQKNSNLIPISVEQTNQSVKVEPDSRQEEKRIEFEFSDNSASEHSFSEDSDNSIEQEQISCKIEALVNNYTTDQHQFSRQQEKNIFSQELSV